MHCVGQYSSHEGYPVAPYGAEEPRGKKSEVCIQSASAQRTEPWGPGFAVQAVFHVWLHSVRWTCCCKPFVESRLAGSSGGHFSLGRSFRPIVISGLEMCDAGLLLWEDGLDRP